MNGYLLPITIALGLGVSTVNVLGMQIVAQNGSTVNTQYYQSVAREAAQAGITAAANCIRSGTTTWSSNVLYTPLTPATNCSGTTNPNRANTVANDPTLSSTYEVGRLQVINANSAVVTSVGKVSVKGPGGLTVKTYTQSTRTFAKTAVTTTGWTSRTVAQVSTGDASTCAVADSWAYCWGDNSSGQLGVGHATTGNNELFPEAVASNTTPVAADPGASHYVCTSWFFGSCIGGYTVIDRPATPIQPASALMNGATKRTVTKISVGPNHTCAVADGKAYCWGDNTYGQLGDRTTNSSFTPVAVDTNAAFTPPPVVPSPCGGWFQPSCTPVVQPTQPGSALQGKTIVDITAGTNFTCAIASDGGVYCWGDNSYGQLGTNDRTDSTIPTEVYKSDAKPAVPAVYQTPSPCGGWFQPSCTPVLVTPAIPAQPPTPLWGKTIVKLSRVKGGVTVCAIDSSEVASCWGGDYVGQVGDGQSAPDTSQVTSSGSNGPSGGNGAAHCSGHTGSGSGNGSGPATPSTFAALQPTLVSGGLKFASIDMYDNYVTALTSGSSTNPNRAYWWGGSMTYSYNESCSYKVCGSNNSGNQWCGSWHTTTTVNYTGNPPTGPAYNGAAGSGLEQKQLSIYSGNIKVGQSCALTGSDIYCATNGANATRIYMDGWLFGKSIDSIDSGLSGYSCVVANGAVGCWGTNSSGQLGDGTTTNRTDPTATNVSSTSDLGTLGITGSTATFDNPVTF